ncbi:MAG: hypothetical protein GY751_19300 [Bacteroidetes bacterium]|nr:hypothetical protein [Bacteroidota bacterium]
MIDPALNKFNKKFPKFPGVTELITEIGKNNVKGGYLECVMWELEKNVDGNEKELIRHFKNSNTERLKLLILQVLEHSSNEELIDFYKSIINKNEDYFIYVKAGLMKIGTKSARTTLWQIQNMSS